VQALRSGEEGLLMEPKRAQSNSIDCGLSGPV